MDFLEIQHTGHGGLRCMTPSKFWEPLHIFEAGEAMYFYFVHKLTILTYDKDSCVRMWDKLGFCRNIRRVHQTVPIHRETHQCHMRNEWLLLSGLSSPSRLRSLSTHTHTHIHTHSGQWTVTGTDPASHLLSQSSLSATSNWCQQLNIHTETTRQDGQEAQLMLTTGSTRLAVSRGQQTWYHFGSIATFR